MINLVSLQQQIVSRKSQIISVFFILEFLLFFSLIFGFFWYREGQTDPQLFVLQYNVGKTYGQVSAVFYMLTLIPGILGRFQVLTGLRIVLMSFRRHLGIVMFMTALVHLAYTSIIPILMTQPLGLPTFTNHQMFGLIAVLLLFPLWLTSNDFSVRTLGKNWKLIHKLTYIALVFIYLHVAWTYHFLRWPLAALIVLEILSFFFSSYKQQQVDNANSPAVEVK